MQGVSGDTPTNGYEMIRLTNWYAQEWSAVYSAGTPATYGRLGGTAVVDLSSASSALNLQLFGTQNAYSQAVTAADVTLKAVRLK